MGNLIIKGKGGAGNKLILQDQAGGAVITTADSGATIADGIALGTPASGVVTNLSGVLPVGVTGGSGLTALGTVASGTIGSGVTMPAGSVLQVISYVNNTTTTTSAATYNHFDFDVVPKASGSKFFIQFNMKASHTQNVSLYFKLGVGNDFTLAARSSTFPSATGSIYMEGYTSNHSANAQINQYLGDYMYTHTSSGSFNVKVQHNLQGATMYLNKSFSYDDAARGRPQSTIQVWEIKV